MRNDSHNFDPRRRWRPAYIFIPFAVIGLALLLGLAVQWLWNAILPQVAPVRELTYWQAVGLLVLSKILFGGWRGAGRYRDRQHHEWRGNWRQMSDEDRERMRTAWRDRCRRRDEDRKDDVAP